MRNSCFFLLLIFSVHVSIFAQDCQIKNDTDWTNVSLKILNEDILDSLEQNGYEIFGENFIATEKKIKELTDLNEIELKRIKMDAANSKSCLVFVDTSYFYDKERLFYIWLVKME